MNRKQDEYRIMIMKRQARAIRVKFCDYKDSVKRNYAIKGHSASSQRGSSWSSPLRSDGSRDDQVGKAGPLEPKLSGDQESQNKGLKDHPATTPMRQQLRRPDGRPGGQV
jgi:hypothetical protein